MAQPKITLDTVTSIMAQSALIELGCLGVFGSSLISRIFGQQTRLVYAAMGAAALSRAIRHINGPDRDLIAKFPE